MIVAIVLVRVKESVAFSGSSAAAKTRFFKPQGGTMKSHNTYQDAYLQAKRDAKESGVTHYIWKGIGWFYSDYQRPKTSAVKVTPNGHINGRTKGE